MAFRSDLESMILAVLNGEPKHGYEISKSIRLLSTELVKVSEGQLYPALHKLEEEGFIRAEWVEQEGKPDRKVYALTETGNGELQKRQAEWNKFAQGINQVFANAKKSSAMGFALRGAF